MIGILLSHSIIFGAGTFFVVVALAAGEIGNALAAVAVFGCVVLALWREGE